MNHILHTFTSPQIGLALFELQQGKIPALVRAIERREIRPQVQRESQSVHVTYLNDTDISSKPYWVFHRLGFLGYFWLIYFLEGCSCKVKILTKNDQAAVIVTVGEGEYHMISIQAYCGTTRKYS